MDKPKPIAFLADKELAKKIRSMQDTLHLKTPGEVVSRALSLMELSMGRKLELWDNDKKIKIDDFSKFNQTVIVEDKP
jgi:hypothetical protein